MSSAASSLMLGVALVSATALMVLSVGARFDAAGKEVMRAEHAIAATGMTSAGPAPLPRELAGTAAAAPGVTHAVALTVTDAKLVSPAPKSPYGDDDPAPVYLMVSGADQAALPSVLDLGGDLRPLRTGEIGLTSTIMKAQKLRKGQRIVVRGGAGKVALTVAGAYHDPSHLFADQALVSPATMDRLDPDAATQAILVRGGTEDGLTRAVARRAADVPVLEAARAE